jgi:P4 family phage/plasmid primase-like protien
MVTRDQQSEGHSNTRLKHLTPQHRRELEASAINLEVLAERGYESIHRPTNGDRRQIERLRTLGIPSWAIDQDRYFPGLLIPMYGPTGQRVSAQWKPYVEVQNSRNGKRTKYASVKGQTNRLDVHPRNKDKIIDPTVELWVTEGIKKGDSLTSRGVCVVSMTGVFNWRNSYGTLGDWEDIVIKGRRVILCFDADTTTNPNVKRAMGRLGQWLRGKGAKQVSYLIVPNSVNGTRVKGVDDYFAAGGALEELRHHGTASAPAADATDDTFSDARLAETIADDVLTDRFIWVTGIGWMTWDGTRWANSTDVEVTEAVRIYVLDRFNEVFRNAADQGNAQALDGWRSMTSAGRMRCVLGLAKGIVERKADDLDADPDLLNTPAGVVNLETGEVHPHDPDLLITKITKGNYKPGYTHPDWDQALQCLPINDRDWLQARTGQGITGHRTPDGIMPVLQGSGENGKSAITTDGVVPAMGDYASMASTKLFQAGKGTEHSTERAELRGKRLLIAEELTEGRSIDVTALKQIQDVGTITARYIRQDNFTFRTSHTLMCTTNYVPIVSETDHGTWRRLALLRFPYTFRKPDEVLESDRDRRGDPELKSRIEHNGSGQHDAIVTWAVEGALTWYACRASVLAPSPQIEKDTRAWRKDADCILGFWDEHLIAEPEMCIQSTEMVEVFNQWLTNSGHNKWAKETFAPRFEQHEETARNRVTRLRTAKLNGLDRRSGWGAFNQRPSKVTVYMGVRWQTASDKERDSDAA